MGNDNGKVKFDLPGFVKNYTIYKETKIGEKEDGTYTKVVWMSLESTVKDCCGAHDKKATPIPTCIRIEFKYPAKRVELYFNGRVFDAYCIRNGNGTEISEHANVVKVPAKHAK